MKMSDRNNDLKPIFVGNEKIAYRDPACIFVDGRYILFMTVSEKVGEYMYNTVGVSESRDLKNFSEIRILTPMDRSKNFCSPGSIVKVGDEYLICITSYPMPEPFSVRNFATDDARLYFMRTRDFKNFSEPEIIAVKGDVKVSDMGRMIDPYLFRDKNNENLYHIFFKQDSRVNHSFSEDLKKWTYIGSTDGGENACVLVINDKYCLLHSPENGIGVKYSDDLVSWNDAGIFTLDQEKWSFASGRLTAGFAMEAPENVPYKYILFFHGSRAECPPETHGAASIALAFTDDFKEFFYDI